MQLGGLLGLDVETLLEDVAERPLQDNERRLAAVRDQTAGNPFFVGEILRELAQQGARWDLEALRVPEGVRAVVGGGWPVCLPAARTCWGRRR